MNDIAISWTEPVFKDNVGVHQMTASYLPGHYFPGKDRVVEASQWPLNIDISEGKHHVLYQAADADGNRARCGFPITVRRERSFPSTTSRPPDQSNNSPYQIIYKMKVCDFFKLLSPNNYPSFCDS